MPDDLDLPLPHYQLPEFELPDVAPILAGAQGPLDRIGDLVEFIWSGAADLGDAIKQAFKTLGDWLWRWIGGAIRWVYGWLVTAITKLFDWVHQNASTIVNFVISQAKGLWDWISQRVGDAIGAVVSASNWLWGTVTTAATNLGKLVTDTFGWLNTNVLQPIAGGISDIVGGIAGFAETVARAIREIAESIGGFIRDAAESTGGFVRDAAESVGGFIRDAAETTGGFIRDAAESTGGFIRDAAEVTGGAIREFAETIGDKIRDATTFVWQNILEPVTGFLDQKLGIPSKLIRGQYPSLADFVDDVLDPPQDILKGIQLFAWTLVVAIPSLLVGFIPALAPMQTRWQQDLAVDLPYRLLTPQEVMTAELRDIPVSWGYDMHLRRSGFDADDVEALRRLRQLIPGPSDLVRMGVREVFTPEIAERFGQFQDVPPQFGDWMARQGYTPEWARNFWAAHWDLPSAGQGFEMLHRGIISQEELALLLRALDVMPFWRDKLTQISYNPLTRVDVRRMFKAGVIQRDKVLQVYRALGLSPEDAEIMTTWVVKEFAPGKDVLGSSLANLTIATLKSAYARRLIMRDQAVESLIEQDYSADEADLIVSTWEYDWTIDPSSRGDVNLKAVSRSIIEDAYEAGLVDFNAAVAELQEQGFTPEDASLLLQLVDLKQARQLADLEADVAVQEFRKGIISDAQLAAQLADLNIPQARLDLLVQLEIARRQAKPRTLTRAEMDRALRAGLIPEDQYRARADAMGYAPYDVDILLALAAPA